MDVRLELVNSRVVSDLYHLDLWLSLDFVFELVPLFGMLVEGMSEFFDFVSNRVLLFLGVLDSIRVDGAKVFLKVVDLVGKSLVFGLELSKMSRARLKIVDLSLRDMLASDNGVKRHPGLPLVDL